MNPKDVDSLKAHDEPGVRDAEAASIAPPTRVDETIVGSTDEPGVRDALGEALSPHEHVLESSGTFRIPVDSSSILAEPHLAVNDSNFLLKPEFHITVFPLDKAKLLETAVKEETREAPPPKHLKNKVRSIGHGIWQKVARNLGHNWKNRVRSIGRVTERIVGRNPVQSLEDRISAFETAEAERVQQETQQREAREAAAFKSRMAAVTAGINRMLGEIDWSYELTDKAFHIQKDSKQKRALTKAEKRELKSNGTKEADIPEFIEKDVHQETVIQMAKMPGVALLYDRIKEELGIDLGPLPPPHVTLYLQKGDKMGIGISSEEDLQSYNPQAVSTNDFQFEKAAAIQDPSVSLEDLKAVVPELARMDGFDQRNKYHALTLGAHTAQVDANLQADTFIMSHTKRDLILLAGKLHDSGKAVPGAPVEKPDGMLSYPNQERYNQLVARKVLKQHFDLSAEDTQFVLKLIETSTNGVLEAFQNKSEPKGGDLKAYEKFLERVADLPGDQTLEEKLQIVMHFNLADKAAHYNDTIDRTTEHNAFVINNVDASIAVLRELQKAFPAIIEAVAAKKNGHQNAGIVRDGDGYKFVEKAPKKKKQKEAALAPALQTLVDAVADTGIQNRLKGMLGKKGANALPIMKKWIGKDLTQEEYDAFEAHYAGPPAAQTDAEKT